MAKRKATAPATGASRHSKRSKTGAGAFIWNPREWTEKPITEVVSVLTKKSDRSHKVIKKVLGAGSNSADAPWEVQAIALIPGCNRIVAPIHYSRSDPDPEHGTVFFEYYPLGDLVSWREGFEARNWKPVPESHIWRFFVQMGQALALLQNQIGPKRAQRKVLLHRDIKPDNILVVENGTTYPSFRLHDFGLAGVYKKLNARKEVIVGTVEWQPPENPYINTRAAEIWSLGACVHYLATGTWPLGDVQAYAAQRFAESQAHPASYQKYSTPDVYYAARVPRKVIPINLSEEQQRLRGLGPIMYAGQERFNHRYSDELHYWMKQCLNTTASKRPIAERLVYAMSLVAKGMLKKMGGQAALVDLDVVYEDKA